MVKATEITYKGARRTESARFGGKVGCDIKWGGGQGSFTDEVTSQDNPEGSKGARYKEIWE